MIFIYVLWVKLLSRFKSLGTLRRTNCYVGKVDKPLKGHWVNVCEGVVSSGIRIKRPFKDLLFGFKGHRRVNNLGNNHLHLAFLQFLILYLAFLTRIRLFILDKLNQQVVLLSNVQIDKLHFLPTDFFPSLATSL